MYGHLPNIVISQLELLDLQNKEIILLIRMEVLVFQIV